jgi:Regulator of ribonuclease activity B
VSWPNDADGDVMRRLSTAGFDFSTPAEIDCDVDFETSPPSQRALQAIAAEFSGATIVDDWVHVPVRAQVTYALVVSVQARLSARAAPYGGRCESWGVLQEPRQS